MVFHVGRNNDRSLYELGVDQPEANGERDLGITIDEKPKFFHAQVMVAKFNKTLGTIRRSIASKRSCVLLPLNAALVRSHLKYCAQF